MHGLEDHVYVVCEFARMTRSKAYSATPPSRYKPEWQVQSEIRDAEIAEREHSSTIEDKGMWFQGIWLTCPSGP